MKRHCSACGICDGAATCPMTPRIVALRREGLTQQEIADSVGLSLHTVWHRLRVSGLTKRYRQRPWMDREGSKQIERLIRRMAEVGCLADEIAAETGLSRDAVYARISRARRTA